METFTPNVPAPPVPIPFGQLTVAVAESLTPSHPITIADPILLSDFPDSPQGAVAYTALQRVSEILSHGFLNPSNDQTSDATPTRELWLSTTSQILVHLHNSIRRSHGADPCPNVFRDLSPTETDSFSLLARTISSLASFFDNRFENLITDPTDPDVESWEVCLRCLEECQYPVTHAAWQSVLMSCAQNIHAAHRTIINDKLRSLTLETDQWVDDRRNLIREAFIEAVTSDDLSSLHDATNSDPRLEAWATCTLTSFTDTVKQFIAQEVLATTVSPILIESLQAAKVKVDTEGSEYLTAYIRDERAKAEAAANADALTFYNDTLRTLKAEALERSKREIAEYKHGLKVKNKERKAALLDDFESRAPKSSSSVSASVARSSRRKARVDQANSVSRPSPGPLRSRSLSRSRSLAPSPDSAVPGQSPDQLTPRASPVCDLPPTRANTAQPSLSLRAPPMDVSVGPPSNSFESAMMHVDTTVLTAFEYPHAPSAFEPQGPPNTQAAVIAPTQPDSSFSSSIDPNTSVIESLICGMSEKFLAQLQESSFAAQSQFSELSQRLQKLEQPPAPYSPSAVAAAWRPPAVAPPAESRDAYAQDVHDDDIPMWYYSDTDANMTDTLEPNGLDKYLRDLYLHRLYLPPSHVLTDLQRDYLLTLPGLFQTFCTRFHISPHRHLHEYDIIPFWDFVDEYKDVESQGRDPLCAVSDALCGGPTGSPDQPEHPVPHPLNPDPVIPPPIASIRLFPPRAPSLPPITVLNPPSAPHCAPVSDHAWGWARPSVAHEDAVPATNDPPAPPPNAPWNVMGKGGGKPRSFAAAAAPRRTAPAVVSPIQTAPRPGDLTDSQLQQMSCDQLLRAYETRFRLTVTSHNVSKLALQQAYKRALESEAAISTAPVKPAKPATQRPRARPISTTEFTITRDPSTRAIQGPQGDPAAIVQSLQTSIRQAFPGGPPPFTLLGGCWSSQLPSNFVLTFSGQPSNDDIKRYSAVLCSPFGSDATILPQRGYTHVSINFVPIIYDDQGNRPSTEALSREIEANQAFHGAVIVSPPKWLRSLFTDSQTHSSVIISFLDLDGSRLARVMKNPIFMFGALCEAKLFNSLPLIRQCDRCHHLGHSTGHCRMSPNIIICSICGGHHASHDHAGFCKGRATHSTLDCNCPPVCINCVAAKLPGKGHLARAVSCPLCKKYRRETNRTGASSEDDFDRSMVVDPPILPTAVPSSQPTDDEQIVFRPAAAPASPPPRERVPPACLTSILADMKRFDLITDPNYFRSLSIEDLRSLSDYGCAKAFSLGILSIPDLIQSMTNV